MVGEEKLRAENLSRLTELKRKKGELESLKKADSLTPGGVLGGGGVHAELLQIDREIDELETAVGDE